MSRDRTKATGRRKSPTFAMLPHALLDSAVFVGLSDKAKTLLIDLLRAYNGRNNGNLAITLTTMRARGWTSNDSLTRAKHELLEAGLLIQTRQGGRHKCSLFAIAWQSIDECGGKHDATPTKTPPMMLSKLERVSLPPAGSIKNKNPAPPAGSIRQ